MGRVIGERGRGDDVCEALTSGANVLDVEGLVCAAGDLVDIEGHAAVALALLADRTLVAPIDHVERPIGRAAVARGPLVVRVDHAEPGRLVDCLGRPLGVLGAKPAPASFSPPVPMWPRARWQPERAEFRRWTLGPIVYDLRGPRDVGTARVALGEPDWLMDDIARHQVHAKRPTIVARVGVPSPGPWVSVGIALGAPWAARWLVPHAAIAIAHARREAGEHAVVIVRDLDRWLAIGGRADRLTPHAGRGGGSVTLVAHAPRAGRFVDAFDEVFELGPIARGEHPRKYVSPPVRVPSKAMLSSALRTRPFVATPGSSVDTRAQLLAVLADRPVDAIAKQPWLAEVRDITEEHIVRAKSSD